MSDFLFTLRCGNSPDNLLILRVRDQPKEKILEGLPQPTLYLAYSFWWKTFILRMLLHSKYLGNILWRVIEYTLQQLGSFVLLNSYWYMARAASSLFKITGFGRHWSLVWRSSPLFKPRFLSRTEKLCSPLLSSWLLTVLDWCLLCSLSPHVFLSIMFPPSNEVFKKCHLADLLSGRS